MSAEALPTKHDGGSTGRETVTRRQFACSVAAAALCVGAGASDEESGAEQSAGEEERLSSADRAEVQARHGNVLRVYGSRLSATQRATLLHILATNQHMLASIRSFSVQNGDAAACTLRLIAPESNL